MTSQTTSKCLLTSEFLLVSANRKSQVVPGRQKTECLFLYFLSFEVTMNLAIPWPKVPLKVTLLNHFLRSSGNFSLPFPFRLTVVAPGKTILFPAVSPPWLHLITWFTLLELSQMSLTKWVICSCCNPDWHYLSQICCLEMFNILIFFKFDSTTHKYKLTQSLNLLHEHF